MITPRRVRQAHLGETRLAHHLRAAAVERLAEREEEAMLRKALQAKPDFGRAWANLGVALAASGDLDGAEEPFRNAVTYDPSGKNWINLAKLHAAKGRTELAKEAAGKARALGV